MAVPFRCTCGKRYRVADDVRGKRIRCKECGEELRIPRKPQRSGDDEWDLVALDENDAVAEDDEGAELTPRAARLPKRGGRRRAGTSGRFSVGDLAVRATGLIVFMATLGNAAYQHQAAQNAPQKGLAEGFFFWGILPIPIVGLLGLYIAYVGEEPDSETRRVNRFRGLIKCGLGVALIALGGVLTFAVTGVAKPLAGVAVVFTGLIIGGIGVIIYGGLSALTGRIFSTSRSRP